MAGNHRGALGVFLGMSAFGAGCGRDFTIGSGSGYSPVTFGSRGDCCPRGRRARYKYKYKYTYCRTFEPDG